MPKSRPLGTLDVGLGVPLEVPKLSLLLTGLGPPLEEESKLSALATGLPGLILSWFNLAISPEGSSAVGEKAFGEVVGACGGVRIGVAGAEITMFGISL